MLSFVDILTRYLLAAVFVFAVTGKIGSRTAWRLYQPSVAALTGARGQAVGTIAALVVAAEAVTVALLVIPSTATAGLGLAMVLLLGFSTAAGRALYRGQRVRCRCFGSDQTVGRGSLIRNGVLVGIAVVGFAVRPAAGGSSALTPVLILAAATAILIAAIVAFSDDLFDALRWSDNRSEGPHD